MSVPPSVVAKGTVKSIGEHNGKPELSIDFPAFESQHPTHINDFPADMELKPGQSYIFELERQNLVKKRTGEYDGSKAWQYYWGIRGFSTEEPSQTPGNGQRNDPAGISIERQTAYKGVIEIYVAKMNNSHLGGAGMLTLWEDIFRDTEAAAALIHGGPVATPDTVQEPESPTHDESQEAAFDALGSSQEPEHKIGNLTDFMKRAMKEGHGASRDVLPKLGVEKPVEIEAKYGNFDLAWKALTGVAP